MSHFKIYLWLTTGKNNERVMKFMYILTVDKYFMYILTVDKYFIS